MLQGSKGIQKSTSHLDEITLGVQSTVLPGHNHLKIDFSHFFLMHHFHEITTVKIGYNIFSNFSSRFINANISELFVFYCIRSEKPTGISLENVLFQKLF